MSGLLSIQSVAGAGPSYTLTVASSAGVVTGNHVVGPLLSGPTHGGIYRVTGVPTGTTIDIEDDLVPGGGAYGAPTSGPSAFWAPIGVGISTGKANNTPFWGDIAERDTLLLEAGSDRNIKSGVIIPGSFSGNPRVATVTFGTAFPDTNYAVDVEAVTINGRRYTLNVENKVAGSFDVGLGSSNIADLVEVGWQAIDTGE